MGRGLNEEDKQNPMNPNSLYKFVFFRDSFLFYFAIFLRLNLISISYITIIRQIIDY